jgi:type IV secretory pathway TraG/TraD family ATPase VirD4
MGLLWNVAKGTWAASSAVSRISTRRMESAIADAQIKGMTSRVRNGLLRPGDAPPPPQAARDGYWDYRALARPHDIYANEWIFPLGAYRDPRRWRAKELLGLPAPVAKQHTMVLGPTRSGKTASIIAPWIYNGLRAGYSVVAVDIKGNGDLIREVRDFARVDGPLGIKPSSWDYSNPAKSLSWNWISDLVSEGDINAAVEAICGRPSDKDPNRFFHQSAMKYLRGLLQLAPDLGRPLAVRDLQMILNSQGLLEQLIDAHRRHPGAARLAELYGLSAGEFMKFTTELKTHLDLLDTAGFHAVTRRVDYSLDALDTDDPSLVIVTAPIADGQLASAASSLFLGQVIQRALRSFRRSARPLLLVIDEAGRVSDRVDLGATLSLVAGAGVSVLLATQCVTQLEESQRGEVLANCGTVVCLRRVSQETSSYFASRLGEVPVESVSRTRSNDATASRSHSLAVSVERAAALGHREISAPPDAFGPWSGVVHSPSVSSRPFLVDLTRPDLVN